MWAASVPYLCQPSDMPRVSINLMLDIVHHLKSPHTNCDNVAILFAGGFEICRFINFEQYKTFLSVVKMTSCSAYSNIRYIYPVGAKAK